MYSSSRGREVELEENGGKQPWEGLSTKECTRVKSKSFPTVFNALNEIQGNHVLGRDSTGCASYQEPTEALIRLLLMKLLEVFQDLNSCDFELEISHNTV
jgi:hypothetical protein